MNYENLLHTSTIESENSDSEYNAVENVVEDLGENERENLVALTYVAKEPNIELALRRNDVIVYQKQNDNTYKAIKIERHLEDVLIK